MQNNCENDEIIIDFKKIGKIICDRKLCILTSFILVICLFWIITIFQPKKYISEAQIFINKAQDTNLSDINPFTIAETGGASSGVGFANIVSLGANLGNELEIMKSPLVMERVIKENKLIYKSGPKKGHYINANDFINSENLNIENIKGSKTISISYKSTDPKEAYNIVNSIIRSYRTAYENINSKKASNDKAFLKQEYEKARKDVDNKIAVFKQFYGGNVAFTSSDIGGTLGLMSMYDKRLSQNLNILTQGNINLKKIQTELDQEFEKLKMIKNKLEWINLVETISKDVTNITILKKPEIKEPYEFCEPNMKITFILAVFLSFVLSFFLVIGLETTSKKITFSDIDENTLTPDQNNNLDFFNLKTKIIIKDIKDLVVISFVNHLKLRKFVNAINKELENMVNITVLDGQNIVENYIKHIIMSENIVILGQKNYSDRKLFNRVKNICKELNKNVINTFIID